MDSGWLESKVSVSLLILLFTPLTGCHPLKRHYGIEVDLSSLSKAYESVKAYCLASKQNQPSD
jgi:hypothetical protein